MLSPAGGRAREKRIVHRCNPLKRNGSQHLGQVPSECSKALGRLRLLPADGSGEECTESSTKVDKKPPTSAVAGLRFTTGNAGRKILIAFQDEVAQRETIKQRIEFHRATLAIAQKLQAKALHGFNVLETVTHGPDPAEGNS